MTRARPFVAALIRITIFRDRRQMNGKPRRVIQERKKVRRRILKRDLECVIVQHLVARLVEVREFSGIERLGVLHHEMHVGIL